MTDFKFRLEFPVYIKDSRLRFLLLFFVHNLAIDAFQIRLFFASANIAVRISARYPRKEEDIISRSSFFHFLCPKRQIECLGRLCVCVCVRACVRV